MSTSECLRESVCLAIPYSNDHLHRLTFSMGWDCTTVHMHYGERLRKHRRWIQKAFSDKESLVRYHPLQQRETYLMLESMIKSPHDLRAHISKYGICTSPFSLWLIYILFWRSQG